MTNETHTIKGVVHGKTVELEREPGFPDGQQVSVVISARPSAPDMEALRRAFGAWGTEPDPELDAFLEQIRRDRKVSRPPIEP